MNKETNKQIQKLKEERNDLNKKLETEKEKSTRYNIERRIGDINYIINTNEEKQKMKIEKQKYEIEVKGTKEQLNEFQNILQRLGFDLNKIAMRGKEFVYSIEEQEE